MTRKGRREPIPNFEPDSEIATLNQDSEGDVTLTLKKEKFAEFLFGFLGAKETLSKTFNEDFTVKMDDLLQFHYLLTQKIAKEQFISLSLETATIEYDDKSKRKINTFGAIEKYSEHRDVAVLSFNLSWNFVFKAPETTNIEQQKVSLYFETKGAKTGLGAISVNIEHTNQVWAAEVLRLFEEHIKKIIVRYSFVYRTLLLMQRIKVFGLITILCFLFLFGSGFYIFIQRSGLLKPVKVKDNFIFDVSKVLVNDPEKADLDTVLQFFMIRDLQNEPPFIISQLQDQGYFNPKYKAIIDRWVSGYYEMDKESKEIGASTEARIREIQSIQNIRWMYPYAMFSLFFLAGSLLGLLYTKLFRIKSVLALTSKGIKYMEKQQKDKSTLMQFAFGVAASIIAAVIYEYALKLLLLK